MKKKIILVAVTIAVTLNVVACGGKAAAAPTEQTTTESSEAIEVTEATTSEETGDTAEDVGAEESGLSMVEFSQIKQGMTVEEVNEILGFEGELTADTAPITTYDWKITTADGTKQVSITFMDNKADIISQVGLDTDRGWISK